MNINEINEILVNHNKWLRNEDGGERADLRYASLICEDIKWATLRKADLSCADIRKADIRWADLSEADLIGADLSGADLRDANLSGADLSGADLSGADLRGADLSGAKGLISQIDFMESNFEKNENGYIAYKTFGSQYEYPKTWKIESGSVISENVNFTRTKYFGSGINVAPLEWVEKKYKGDIWKVLIRWEWLCGICVPYNSDGIIRCEKVELIEIVNRKTLIDGTAE